MTRLSTLAMPLSRTIFFLALLGLAVPASAQIDAPEPSGSPGGVSTQAIGPASALAPREIPFQGVLEDGGAPVTTSTSVVFALFEGASGGTAVWTETQSVTPNADGLFAVRLGSVTALPVISEPLWLEVTVGGTALGPRTALGAAPYALAMHGIRVEPAASANDGPSIAAGHPLNEANTGAVVAGGGRDDGSGITMNKATGTYSTISGGDSNTASATRAAIGGGRLNTASANNTVVGGGLNNTASDSEATVGGGNGNTASGNNTVVGGGASNTASSFEATVSGGFLNTASGSKATVPGGYGNHARGEASFAAGFFARAIHDGTFVWSDNSQPLGDSLVSTGQDQFLIRAAGGVGIGTASPSAALHVQNNGGSGLSSPAFTAVNTSTANGIAAYLKTSGADGTLVLSQSGSGALIRAFSSGLSNLLFEVQNDGDVIADGTFTGGGADFAEYFPLASSSTAPRAGDVVGVTAGRVGLATTDAEQVMIVSSNPAFVGNPDAEDGGTLVALVGQAEVRLASSNARIGDLLVASGASDGTARAVSPVRYNPATDGVVIGRVLELADDGMAIALVGVDEAAALRDVVVRQQGQIDSLTARLDALERLISSQTASR